MPRWPPRCYQRAAAYVTEPSGRLLVFDQVGVPGAGTQVPAGGIKTDEDHEAAVLRELFEESGISAARLVRKLGECWFVAERGQVQAGDEEQVHHTFHLHLDEPTPDATWEWDECDGGEVVKGRYAFRWVDFDAAVGVLHPIQAMWIPALRYSLRHTRRSPRIESSEPPD